MGVYRRGKQYWLTYTFENRQVRVPAETTNKRTAEKIYHKRMADIAEGKYLDIKKNEKVLFKDFAEIYMQRHAIPFKKSWKRSDKSHIASLTPFFGEKYLYEITSMMIEDCKIERQKTVKRSSIKRELSTLCTMLNKAIKWKLLLENPMKDVERYRGDEADNQRVRYLEKDEIARLLSFCHDLKLKNVVSLALHTGMRKGEIQRLQWNDVDFQKRQLVVTISKNGTKRYLPLDNSAVSALMAQPKHASSPLVFPNEEGKVYDFRKAFETAITAAKIVDFRFHDLRHTFASHLVMSGISIYTVMELLGHRSLKMTMRYAHLSPDFQAKAVKILDDRITVLSQSAKLTEKKDFVSIATPISASR